MIYNTNSPELGCDNAGDCGVHLCCNPRYPKRYFCFPISLIFALSLLINRAHEIKVNMFFKAPEGSGCLVTGSMVDRWLHCNYREQYCTYWCTFPSCYSLMSQYDGSRDMSLLKNPGQISQSCCAGTCCMHETCTTYCHDDSGGGGGGGGGSWSDDRRRTLRGSGDDGELSRALVDGAQGSGEGAADALATSLDDYDSLYANITGAFNSSESSCSTSCTCDSYGDDVQWFSCDIWYEGVVSTRYRHPDKHQNELGTTFSATHEGQFMIPTFLLSPSSFLQLHNSFASSPLVPFPAGPCHNKHTKSCAQSFVNSYPVGDVIDCWCARPYAHAALSLSLSLCLSVCLSLSHSTEVRLCVWFWVWHDA